MRPEDSHIRHHHDISRQELIDRLASGSSSLAKSHGPGEPKGIDRKVRGLAQTYLSFILGNSSETFTDKKAKQIQKKFEKWKDKYEETATKVATLTPTHEGKNLETHNITSLPKEWTAEKFFSSKVKQEADIEEKENLQENLHKTAAASYGEGNESITFKSRESYAKDITVDTKLMANLEQLARGYAYKTPRNGEILQIYSDETKKMESYKVKLIPMTLGIYAFGLTPIDKDSKANPILLFRGTSFYPSGQAAGETVKTDFHPLGIGYGSYMQGKKAIADWMSEVYEKTGNKVLVTGHSLGSAYATYAAIDNHDKVKFACGFGATKVSFTFNNKWKKVRDKLTILNFNTPGDKLANFSHVRIASHHIEGTAEHTPESELRPNENKPIEVKTSKIWAKIKANIAYKLEKVRIKSAAHRISYFDKNTTLHMIHKKKKTMFEKMASGTLGFAKNALAVPLFYITWSAFFLAKRAILGDADSGWFSLFRKRTPKEVEEEKETTYELKPSPEIEREFFKKKLNEDFGFKEN